MLGNIHSIETFGSADGPGVRYLIFLKGCNMRCKYCHNPDTWAKTEGEMKTPEEILAQALRYKNYWGKKGGITVSGGEALLQIDFVIELFTLAKEKGVNTCLDTSGNPFTREEPFYSKFEKLMEVTDLFMLDIKEIDEEEHKKLTGQTNANILDMARCLSEHGKKMWIRHVLVPGITDDEGQLMRLRALLIRWIRWNAWRYFRITHSVYSSGRNLESRMRSKMWIRLHRKAWRALRKFLAVRFRRR